MATVKGDCKRGGDQGGEKLRGCDILEHAFEYLVMGLVMPGMGEQVSGRSRRAHIGCVSPSASKLKLVESGVVTSKKTIGSISSQSSKTTIYPRFPSNCHDPT